MLSSLPVISPRDSHSLWYSRTSDFCFTPSYSQSQSDGFVAAQHQQLPHHNCQNRPRNATISPLTQLALDEQSVDHRKLNIQRFGATWIKPPGMSKTLQGELDEKAEREETEHQQMIDEVDITGEGVFEEDEDGHALRPQERDLDADIPVADSDRDDSIPGSESFADASDEGDDVELDLDADIPEADTDALWNESDEASEQEDEGEYHSDGQDTNVDTSITRQSNSIGPLDESPQQAVFSHDEGWLEPAQTQARGYDWRARPRYRRDLNDSMDVDE
ncbi:hypothetical protein EDC01DRAFT_169915 [Geopyxis carbonaria]|nr:hypothetical protein EDC01DRAFT_169915 [Geopyxis carbonaria]